MPNDYYTLLYTGEKTDELLRRVDEGEIIIPSSTAELPHDLPLTEVVGQLNETLDDTGAVSATEVTT